METRWSLKLEDKAAANAKRIKREVVALNAAMRELKDLAGLTDKALRGMGGGDTSRRLRAQARLIREQTRALREQRATHAQRVRDDRAADRQRRRETKQQLDAHAAVARVSAQREQREARARREADGHYATFQRGERRQAREREQRDAQRQRREAADRRMADGHFAAFQRGEQRAGREREQRVARQSRLDDANRRLADRHFSQFQREERVSARQRERDGLRDGRNNQSYFQRLSRQRVQSFRENDRLRRGQERAEQQRRRTVDRDWQQARGSLLSMAGNGASAITSGLMSIVGATLSAITAVAGLAAGFAGLSLMIGGTVLRMISFRESTLLTLATLARAPGEAGMNAGQRVAARQQLAREQFYGAQDLARRTPLEMSQVVTMQREVATAGYQGAAGQEMLRSAADVGALRQDDPTAASRYILQMGQLERSTRARAADYRPAVQAAGIDEHAAIRRAAIAAGVVQRNGEADPAYQRRIEQAQGNGTITGRQMAQAIREEQRAQLGGRAGSFAESQNGSMAAVLSNLGGGLESFVTSIHDIERLPGILLLKEMLQDVGDMLAGATNNGKRLQAFFATFVNGSAGELGKIFGKRGFDGMLSDAIDLAAELLPIVRGVLGAFREGFMEGFGPFLQELRAGAGDFLSSGGHDLIQWAREFGRGLGILAMLMLRVTMLATQMFVMFVAAVGPVQDFGDAINRVRAQLDGIRRQARAGLDPFGAARDAVRDRILPPGSTRRSITDLLGLTDPSEVVGDFESIGADMGRGVAAGFRSQQAFMQSEVSSVMNSLPTQARTDLAIKSPSRVMAEIGEFMAMGVTQGLDSGAGGVQSAMSNVVAPPGLPGFGGAGMGALGGVNVGGVTVIVQGGATNEETGDALAARMEEFFAGFFERAQLASGF
ncbi:MAG: hypothetical protein EPO40_19525 [Myxococcaceae bacterium]|nr:MAG: hypothetical protein EPO40_19525 [Myxococcaceae bacterium]